MSAFEDVSLVGRKTVRVDGRGMFVTNSESVEFTNYNMVLAYPMVSPGGSADLLPDGQGFAIPFEAQGYFIIDQKAKYNLLEMGPFKRFDLNPYFTQTVAFFVPFIETIISTQLNIAFPDSGGVAIYQVGVSQRNGQPKYYNLYGSPSVTTALASAACVVGDVFKGANGYAPLLRSVCSPFILNAPYSGTGSGSGLNHYVVDVYVIDPNSQNVTPFYPMQETCISDNIPAATVRIAAKFIPGAEWFGRDGYHPDFQAYLN